MITIKLAQDPEVLAERCNAHSYHVKYDWRSCTVGSCECPFPKKACSGVTPKDWKELSLKEQKEVEIKPDVEAVANRGGGISMDIQLFAKRLTHFCHECSNGSSNALGYCTVRNRYECPFSQNVRPEITCRSITVEQWLSVLRGMTEADGGAATESEHDDAARGSKVLAAADASAKKRGSVLLEALEVINGQRIDQYGNPEDSFDIIAEFWSSYTGVPLKGKDVAMMMVLLKIAREMKTHRRDNIVDACGYLALKADMVKESTNA